MGLDSVRADVAVVDGLLREVAQRPVDLDDPDWMAGLGRSPMEEAGVTAEATAALTALLDAYETGDASTRDEVRSVFRAHPSFRWAAHLPAGWQSAAELRRRLVHLSAKDQGADPRDELMAIWGLCGQARELGIEVEPILREVAELSSEVDLCGFGSMQSLILRGPERRSLG